MNREDLSRHEGDPRPEDSRPNLKKAVSEGIIRGFAAAVVRYCDSQWHLVQHFIEWCTSLLGGVIPR